MSTITMGGKTYYPQKGRFLSCDSQPEWEGKEAFMYTDRHLEYQTIVTLEGRILPRSDFQDFDFLSEGLIYRIRDGKCLAMNGISGDIPLDTDEPAEELLQRAGVI